MEGKRYFLRTRKHNPLTLLTRAKFRLDTGELVDTTVGRVLVYERLPKGADFAWINKILKKSDVRNFIEQIYYKFGAPATVDCLDKIKKLGFYYATISGISFSLSNLTIPEKKDAIIHKAEKEVVKAEKMYMDGAITDGERHNKIISIWGHATAAVAGEMYRFLEEEDKAAFDNKDLDFKPFNPIFMMLESGARGSKDQIKQLAGMRGMMAKPTGEIIETPVKSNFKEGLRVSEYFISTHGARKGQADTALKTANSGYLTRRLVDVAQDVVVTMEDCKTLGYIEIVDLKQAGEVVHPVAQRAFGRILAADLKDAITGKLLFKQGDAISRSDIITIDNAVLQFISAITPSCFALT